MAGLREVIRQSIREAIKEALEEVRREVKEEIKEIIKEEATKIIREELQNISLEDIEEREVIKEIKEVKKDIAKDIIEAEKEEIKEEVKEVKTYGLEEFLEKPMEEIEEEKKKMLKLFRGKIIITARRSDVATPNLDDFVLNVVEKVILSAENEELFLETLESLENRLKNDIREFLSNFFNEGLADSVYLRSDIEYKEIGEVETAESRKTLVKCILIVDNYDYSEELESFLRGRGW